ncbi:MAG: CsgG/HfaB family protein [Deferribacterales bacterium]
MRTVLVVIFAYVLCVSCAERITVINAKVLMPAQAHSAIDLRKLAVMPMAGEQGYAFTSEIETVISSIIINDKPYFTLVDRSALDKVISEMQLNVSGLVENEVAASVGRLIGADGIIIGAVNQRGTNTQPYTENRYYTECGAYSYVTGPYNTQIPVCVNWIQKSYTVQCYQKSAIFSFSVKLIEVQTGRVVYANTYPSANSDSACVDRRAVESDIALLRKSVEGAKTAFRQDIAPYYAVMKVKVMDETDGIKESSDRKKFETALEYSKSGRVDRACELWREIPPGASFPLAYNLAACAEVFGELEKALDLYNKADRIFGKPNADINASLVRVRKLIEDKKKLQTQIKN